MIENQSVEASIETNFETNTESMAPGRDLVAEGERLFSEGRLSEAGDMFWRAAEECPGNAMAWNNLAVIAMLEGRDPEAEKHLRQALEVKADFLEARWNLVEIHSLRGHWSRAVKELLKILEFKPGDMPAVKRLAQVYMTLEQPDKARELLEASRNMGAMKAFVDSLWLAIKYCAMADELSARDKLEKLVGTLLKYLDGQDGRSRRYRLVTNDEETGEEIVLEDFFEAFYYKESQAMALEGEESRPELILTIGDNKDWLVFRNALREEMKAEGGCLGDFTQTKKVMRHEGCLAKYNLAATLQYFQKNVGPCDCHVLRAVLV
jgi:tetratricopeptide (TPR) repeat protein